MSTCRTCKAEIRWELRGEKSHALDADGSNHWTHCTGRRRKKKKAALRIVKGALLVGANYKPIQHRPGCDVLPWDACSCGAGLKIPEVQRLEMVI